MGEYQASAYDEATRLLVLLRDLAVHQGQEAAFSGRVAALAGQYQRRTTFIARLRQAGLLGGSAPAKGEARSRVDWGDGKAADWDDEDEGDDGEDGDEGADWDDEDEGDEGEDNDEGE